MANFNIEKKLKEIAKSKSISIRQLCIKIGITESGLNRSLKANSIKVETLQKIAEVFEVPITYFLAENELDNKYGNNNIIVNDLEMKIIRYKHSILNLRSYINIGAIEGKGVISIKFQEDILNWNISWGKLEEPISKEFYEENAKEIGDELILLLNESNTRN